MAYRLDPLYLGIGLPFQIRKVIEDQLCAMSTELGIYPPPIIDSRVHQEKLFLQYKGMVPSAVVTSAYSLW
jgi:hypothetical protein